MNRVWSIVSCDTLQVRTAELLPAAICSGDQSSVSLHATSLHNAVRAEIQAAVDAVNTHFARSERIKRFAILDRAL